MLTYASTNDQWVRPACPLVSTSLYDVWRVRKLYWLDRGGSGVRRKLARANLDGSDVETLVTDDLYRPTQLALSDDKQLVYWTDQYSHKVCLLSLFKLKNFKGGVFNS